MQCVVTGRIDHPLPASPLVRGRGRQTGRKMIEVEPRSGRGLTEIQPCGTTYPRIRNPYTNPPSYFCLVVFRFDFFASTYHDVSR